MLATAKGRPLVRCGMAVLMHLYEYVADRGKVTCWRLFLKVHPELGMESGFWSRAACSKHSRALSQMCFLLCDPMFRFARVFYLLRMLLPPWDLKRAPVLSLAGRQILLACDRINKVRCLPVSVIQGKCFMWVAFYAQEQKGCCLFLYLPIGMLPMVCLPSSTQTNYVGSHLGWVRSNPGADIICSWYLLCTNINRRRFSLSDAGEQINFELSAHLGENTAVHSKYVLAVLLRMHFMCEPYAIFYT